jgi:hypothetical protein
VPDAGHLLVIPAWQRILAHVAGGPPELRLVDAAPDTDEDVADGVEEMPAA